MALRARRLIVPGLLPIDLDVEDGQCVALSGPSGSGKTLVLRALADLDPRQGEVSLDEHRRDSIPAPAWRRMVTYLAAESGWWAETVGAHFPDRAAARALLPELGLPARLLDRAVATVSTGERQRLALARALLVRPRVMLLDEPTAPLDEEATRRVEAVLAQRLRQGAAILLVTHDPAQADRLAHRRLCIERGVVRAAGP